MSAQSPVHACEKFLLPALSTHLAVACDFSVRCEYLSQANPAGRLFRFRRANPSHLASAAAMASLAFWWARCARLSRDGAFTLYWECINGGIPSSSNGFRLAAEAAVKLFEGTQLAARDRLTAWWADRQDAAFLRALQLTEGKLRGTGITSVTAAALKIPKAGFQQLSSISPDGEYFPTEPDVFKEERLCEAMELHCGRYIGSSAAWLRRLADQYRPRMSDRPDITTATRLAHAQRGEHAVDPKAPATPGSPPRFSGGALRNPTIGVRGGGAWGAGSVAAKSAVTHRHRGPGGAIACHPQRGSSPHPPCGSAPLPPEKRAAMAGAHEPAGHAGRAGAAEGVHGNIPPPPDGIHSAGT